MPRRWTVVLLAPLLLAAGEASAHVKWFADFREDTQTSVTLDDYTVFGLLLLSLAGIFLARLLHTRYAALKVNNPGEATQVRNHRFAKLLMRLGTVVATTIAWHEGVVFTPELEHESMLIATLQLVTVAGAASLYADAIVAGALLLTYAVAVTHFGILHMLDYTAFLGVAGFLLVNKPESPTARRLGTHALYIGTGLSLCWAGLEKLIFPEWSAQVIAQFPRLTLGLPLEFFIPAAAFVEFSVGYLFITQTLPRVCAVALSALMIYTATLFGMLEVKGHLIFHVILVCFLILGANNRKPRPELTAWGRSDGSAAVISTAYTALHGALFGLMAAGYMLLAQSW